MEKLTDILARGLQPAQGSAVGTGRNGQSERVQGKEKTEWTTYM